MSEALEKRVSELEEQLKKAMEILERTPLNDEMQAAVEICLKESEWFTKMFQDVVNDMGSDVQGNLESYVDEEVSRQLDRSITDAVESEVDRYAQDLKDIQREVEEVREEVTGLDGRVGVMENEVEEIQNNQGEDK